MIDHLPQALSSLQTALTIGKSLIGLKSSAESNTKYKEFTDAIIEANCRIIDSQKIQSALSSEIDELKQECMRLKNWNANEKSRYVRKQIAPGVFTYIENSFMDDLQNAHKYCCNCFDKTIKSTLQQSEELAHVKMIILTCPNGCPKLQFRQYSENS